MSMEEDKPSGTSLEKDRYYFDQSDLDRVQRRLKQRHVQMFVPLVCLCVQNITLIPCDRFHRIAVSVSCLLLSVPISLSRCADCRHYRNGIIPWVRICVARCGTSGRTVGICLGWHGGVFVRTFPIIGHVRSKASSKVAVFHWRNDVLSAYLWHFSTLRFVPIDSYTSRVSHVSRPYAAARWVQPSFGAAVSGLALNRYVSRLIFRVV